MTYLAIGCLVALLLAQILSERPGGQYSSEEPLVALMIIIPLAVLVADVC